jgi:hypothetical protein
MDPDRQMADPAEALPMPGIARLYRFSLGVPMERQWIEKMIARTSPMPIRKLERMLWTPPSIGSTIPAWGETWAQQSQGRLPAS